MVAKAIGLALAFIAPAYAADNTEAQIQWTLPAKYLDGTKVPVKDFASVTILWNINGGAVSGKNVVSALPPVMLIPTPCGVYTFVGQYTTKPTAHVPNSTQTSASVTWDSGVKCKVPVAPGAFVIT